MNQSSQEVRQIFIKLRNDNFSKQKLIEFTGKCKKTIENWLKLTDEELLKNTNPITNQRKDSDRLKQVFEANPLKFHKELEEEVGLKKSQIGYWRKKLGFTRKKGQKTYKEQDEVKKKESEEYLKDKSTLYYLDESGFDTYFTWALGLCNGHFKLS